MPWIQLCLNDSSFSSNTTATGNRKKSILLSAENFSVLPLKYLRMIRSLFPSTTKIYILIAYRTWLEKMYSEYTQITKANIFNAETIGEYIYRNYGYVNQQLTMEERFNQGTHYFTDIMYKLQTIFPLENIYIIDYLGIQKANKDITYGFFCEIMSGILCKESKELSQQTNQNFIYNVKPDGHLIHLVSILRDYIYLKRFSFIQNLPRFFSRDLVLNYTQLKDPFPVKSSNLQLIQPYAIQLDQAVRKEFGNRMMYANETAAREAIEQFKALELDTTKFFTQEKWINWLEKEFDRLYEMGMIIPRDRYHSHHFSKISETKFVKPKKAR